MARAADSLSETRMPSSPWAISGSGSLPGPAVQDASVCMLGLVVADSCLDVIFGQDRAVDLDRWQDQLLGDLGVLDGQRYVERLAPLPRGHERARGDGRAATVGLEARVFDHARGRVDLDLQLHDVAAGGGAPPAGANRFVALFEGADVAGVFVVVNDLVAVCHGELQLPLSRGGASCAINAPTTESC